MHGTQQSAEKPCGLQPRRCVLDAADRALMNILEVDLHHTSLNDVGDMHADDSGVCP